MKKEAAIYLAVIIGAMLLFGCSADKQTAQNQQTKWDSNADKKEQDEMEIQVFIAASLNTVMEKIAAEYNKINPQVKIIFNAGSSGTLLTQIQEGYECDIFFSAAQKQMDTLETEGMLVAGTRANVVNNQVVVVALKDSSTTVTGLKNLEEAESIALAGGNVPVGKYTRQALSSLGKLEKTEDVSTITTEQISKMLGGAEISEQDNVSKVLTAVTEGSCEVGTIYYSDIYGHEDELKILEYVSQDQTGAVSYPIGLVTNEEADELTQQAAKDFCHFILSDEAKVIFERYYFNTEMEAKYE